MSNAAFSISETPPRTIAGITAFRDHAAALAALEAEFGAPPPTSPSFIRAGEVTLSCLAPGRYYASAPASSDLHARLFTSLAGLAAITDQSDLWHSLTLTGPAAIETLSRLLPTDLSAANFAVGSVILTRVGHLNIRLWHLDEATYEIAASRSYGEDLRHLLQS